MFEYLAAQTGWGATYTGGDEPVRLSGARVGAVLRHHGCEGGARAQTSCPARTRPARTTSCCSATRCGARVLAPNPGVIGRQITLDGEPHEIVGVLESSGTFDRAPQQIWKPLAFFPDNMTRDFHWFGAVGKLKAGVTLEQARAAMDVIGKRIAEDYPDSNQGWSVSVNPLAEQMIGPQIRTAVIACSARPRSCC